MLTNAKKKKIDVSVFQKTILNLYSSVKPRYSQRKQPTSRDAASWSSCSALLTDLYDVGKKEWCHKVTCHSDDKCKVSPPESTKYNLSITNQILTWSHFRNQEIKITLYSEGSGNLKNCCYDRKKKRLVKIHLRSRNAIR